MYTTAANVVERPDGVKIGGCFILAILGASLASRLVRALELRTSEVVFDAPSRVFVRDCSRRTIRLVANEADTETGEEYADKIRQIRRDHDLPVDPDVIFVEVSVSDPSDFAGRLEVHGEVLHGRHRVITMEASSVPNALAALVIAVRDETGVIPHLYFEWTEGNPFSQISGSCCSGTARWRR